MIPEITPHSTVPMAKPLLLLLDDALLLASTSFSLAMAERSVNSRASPGIASAFSVGVTVGRGLVLGRLDVVGDAVTVGETLGSSDGTTDGRDEGLFDVDGADEG